jgi:predicted acylesterase/phospholipase RssA
MQSFSTPFNSIALALSGGGFRAAAFSLGMMSYLDRVKLPGDAKKPSLLDHVEFISSASGGTITATLYGMYMCQGKTFDDCFKFLLVKMQGEELLNAVLEKLNDDAQWPAAGKGRTLINAFAKVYNEQLFSGETFNVFWNQQPNHPISVCFNTTDFYRGLSFRFQTDGDSKSFEFTGNRYVHFDKDNPVYKEIRLADILAASSCFPAGFEPIVFPDDFVHDTLSREKLEKAMLLEAYDTTEKVLTQPVAFMDGGITDNQGLYSAMLADERKRSKKQAFDIIMVGDVTSYFMNPYKPVKEEEATGLRAQTLNGLLKKVAGIFRKIKIGLITSIIIGLLSLAGVIVNRALLLLPYLNGVFLFLFGASLVAFIFLLVITRMKNKQEFLGKIFRGDVTPEIKTVLDHLNVGDNFSDDIINKLTGYLGNTKLNVIEKMLKARAASVLTMTMDINLKHTRRLIFELFFENKQWDNRRLYNVAFELSAFNKPNRAYRIAKKLDWSPTPEDKALLSDVTDSLQHIAEDARTMGTTLWFGKDDMKNEKLKKVVTCGQFTTCMNLIEYVLSIERKVERKELSLEENELNKLKAVKEQLLKDWQQFKVNPYFMYNISS